MDGKSSDWRPTPTVCRCCLAEGCYKDISTEYFWMGKREVYSEMLSETFDIAIAYSQSGGPNSNSRLICEPCISRLRDATEFKRQVLECEKTFMQHLDPGRSTVTDIPMIEDLADKEVKLERVKEEKEQSSDDDFDDRPEIADDDDDDDDLDDQPLTKLASKVPKKESVDILDLLDNSKAAEKRKSTVKVKTPAVKKAKTKTVEAKPTASKAKTPEKKKKAESYDPTRSNAEIIIRHTTAYPFRVNDKSILCVYCQELYDDPEIFRRHMAEEHENFSLKVAFYSLPKMEFIKADLTDLRCRLCSSQFESLAVVAEHLKTEHGQAIDANGKLGVMPYYLQKDIYNCAVCEKNFPSLFHLNRHTITHFLSYVCHYCGASYVATTGLLRHVRSKHQDYEVVCKTCRKVFPTMEAKEKHRRTEKSCFPYCCPKCSLRFLHWKSRKLHMETEHGHSKRTYRCPDCDRFFPSEKSHYDHFKLHHSDECATCEHCGLKFTSRYRLKRHMMKHTF